MVKVMTCDFSNKEHRHAVVTLMNHYLSDNMGGNLPALSPEKEVALLDGLEKHPSKLVLLATYGDNFAGLTNCFKNFGTFDCKPFINIHDIVVLAQYRGKGIGKALMQAIDKHARALGCGKSTLEVRYDNPSAQRLYRKLGYNECEPLMHFWIKQY